MKYSSKSQALEKLELKLQQIAQEFLLNNDLEAAWKTLLSFNN